LRPCKRLFQRMILRGVRLLSVQMSEA